MSKRKLTQNQTRRIQSNNAKALHRHKKKEVEWQDDMLGESQDGVVVTRYSVHADVENAQGEIFRCNLRRTLSSLVVGDKVIWRQEPIIILESNVMIGLVIKSIKMMILQMNVLENTIRLQNLTKTMLRF